MPKTKQVIKEINDTISANVQMQNSETRKFKMHPDLLFSVIHSQAGTHEKALLEGTMNTVDAGATECVIEIDSNGYSIRDNGKGFASKEEVDLFFETFGTPHKEGDATYGRFRMGRGQLFAFSSTVWRTNTFEMSVDIKKDGLDYKFTENLPAIDGCEIKGKWYDRLKDVELFNIMKEFEKLVKYMQIPVILNGKNISLKAEDQKWDYKEEDFFIKTNQNQNTLSVYNMGSLVAHYPASRFGVGGTVVTKKALQVNFARNDVLVSQCALWKKIHKKLQEIMGIETAKKSALTDFERSALLDAVLNKEILMGEVINKGLILDVSGKKLTFANLLKKDTIAFSSENRDVKRAEEKINDLKICTVLDHSVLQTFDCANAEEFVKKVVALVDYNNEVSAQKCKELEAKYGTGWETHRRTDYRKYYDSKIYDVFNPKIKDIKEMTSKMKNSSDIVDVNKLSKKEKAFLTALEEMNTVIWDTVIFYEYKKNNNGNANNYWEVINKLKKDHPKRKIVLGESDIASGWTDGHTYVAMNKRLEGKSAQKIVSVMLHEYCHNKDTLAAHDHDVNFYELFHDVSLHCADAIEKANFSFQREYNKALINAGVMPRKDYQLNLESKTKFDDLNEQAMTEVKAKPIEEKEPGNIGEVEKTPAKRGRKPKTV